METLVRTVGQILEERTQFAVPVFQRHYVWTEKNQLAPLWDDVLDNLDEALESKPKRYPHYMGALIFTLGVATIGRVPVKQVIDGQQRLTTFQILLYAIAEIARQRDWEQTRATALSYVTNDRESLMQDPATERHKLLPTAYDRTVYFDVATGSESSLANKYSSFYWGGKLVQNRSPKLLLAYFFFIGKLKELLLRSDLEDLGQEQRLAAVLDVILKRFSIVTISLSDEDDAQTIFSTLNARGEPLNATDLIRNDIFHRSIKTKESAETLFADHWSRFEDPFWENPERQGRVLKPRLEFFFANVLVAEMAREVNLSKIYPEYRAYATARKFETVEDELEVVGTYADPYEQLVTKSGDGPLAEFAALMAAFDTSTVFPAAMALAVNADADDLQRALSYLASFVVRRTVCSMDAKSLTKNTVALIEHMKQNGFTSDQTIAFFRSQTAESTRHPTNLEFASSFVSRSMYGGGWDRRTRAILLRLEDAAQGKFDDAVKLTEEFTLEHVMPLRWKQNWPLMSGELAPYDSAWELQMDEDASDLLKEEIGARLSSVDTIGNLVLVNQAKNSKLSNGSFESKRELLTDSPVKLTRQVGSHHQWGVDEIRNRSQELAQLALQVWPSAHD